MTYHECVGEVEAKVAYLADAYRGAKLYKGFVMMGHGFLGEARRQNRREWWLLCDLLCFIFVLFAGYYFLYFVELVEGFYGSEVVDVETDYFVPYLT